MAKKIFNWITTVLVVLAILLAILLVGVRVFGYKPFAILSPSMTPKYGVGSLIYVKPKEFEEIKVGDVITRIESDGKTTVTHRVVEIDKKERTFRTKGDANKDIDGAKVLYENVIGRVEFSIPYIGYISIFISEPFGKFAAIAVIAFLLLLILIPDAVKIFSKKGKTGGQGKDESEKSEAEE